MPLTPYMKKNILDFLCGGAAPTRPAELWMQFATGLPNDSNASDGGINSRVMLVSGAFKGMAPASGTPSSVTWRSIASNASPTVANQSVRGWNIYDSAAGGTRLMYGTMTSTFSATSGSGIAFSAGRLIINIL